MRMLFILLLAACSHAPAPQPDADAQKCAAASDCAGMLPHICRACPDGGSECAHWECISAACATVLCGAPAQ